LKIKFLDLRHPQHFCKTPIISEITQASDKKYARKMKKDDTKIIILKSEMTF